MSMLGSLRQAIVGQMVKLAVNPRVTQVLGDPRLMNAAMKAATLGGGVKNGVDKAGRPICIVRVRLHKAADQTQEALERYTVYLIESTRMVLAPPVETAVSSQYPNE